MVERFEDIYEFNIEGNFERELRDLSASLKGVQAQWDSLRNTSAKTAVFAKPREEIKKLSGAAKTAAQQTSKLVGEQEKLASANQSLGRAYNELVRDQNRINAARIRETIALKQASESIKPRIIQARAEARAIRQITRALEDKAAKERFAQLAAQVGLDISKKTKKVFDAEAVAAERAAKAQEELAVARALAARGLDTRGVPQVQGPPLPPDIARAQKAQLEFQKQLEALKLKEQTLNLQKNSKEYQNLSTNVAKARQELALLDGSGKKTEGTFNRISFTFRRLIGILAAFTVARVAVREFANLVKTAISFNAELERARVGISGLIVAAGEVRTPTGEQLGIGDQLVAAQDIAIDQMRKLRKEALATAATYEELALAFQSAIAPGLQANLTLDQIREITVTISQAATGLGVAQNQLAEEIRSLFQGTITPRNTRIATALGISNADIRRAKEMGTLFEFLQTRFEAISRTGVTLMDTFSAQMSNASDAFKQLLAESSGPLFEQLKAGLIDVQNAIFALSEDDILFQPKALAAFEALFDGLAKGVEGVRAAFSQIDPRGLIDSFSALGETLGLAATLIANIFKTAFNLASPLISVFSTLVGTVNSLVTLVTTLSGGVLGSLFQRTGQVLVLFLGIRFAIAKILSLGKFLVAQWALISITVTDFNKGLILANANLTGIRKITLLITAAFRKLLLPILAIVAAITLVDFVLKKLEVDFSLFDKVSEIFGFLNQKLDQLIVGAEGASETLKDIGENSNLGVVSNDFRKLIAELEQFSDTLEQEVLAAITDLDAAIRGLGAPAEIQRQLDLQARAFKEFDKATREFTLTVENLKKEQTKLIDTAPGLEGLTQAYRTEVPNITRDITKLSEALQIAKDEQDEIMARARAHPFGFIPAEDVRSLDRLKKEIEELSSLREHSEEQLTILSKRHNKAQEELTNNKARQKIINEQLLKLEQEKAKALSVSQKLLQTQLTTALKSSLFAQELNRKTQGADLQAAQAALLIAQQTNSLQGDILAKSSAVLRNRADFLIQEAELLKGIEQSQEILETIEGFEEPNINLIESLKQQISGYRQQLTFARQVADIRNETLKIEEEIARVRGSDDFGGGIGLGLRQFAQENQTLAQVGENFGKAAADGISEFGASAIAESVAAAFDPTRNFDLATAAGNFLLQLGTGLLTDLLKNILANLLAEEVTDLTGEAAKISLQTTLAAIQTTAAATSSDTLITGALAVDGILTIAGETVANAMVRGASQAAAILAGTSVATGGGTAGAGATGGRVDRLPQFRVSAAQLARTHRRAPGLAMGGRPRGIDPRDTIPAWLRPGEWVIRPESVRKYGDGIFDLLNRGRINPALLRSLSAGAPVVKASTSKRSFATGGKTPSTSSRDSTKPILSLQFFDNQVMDRALAAGPDAAVRFARRKRGAYRAALGLEPNT